MTDKKFPFIVFSELTGKEVNLNKPFLLFINTQPLFFQTVEVDSIIVPAIQDKLHPECMVKSHYSPYQDFYGTFEYVNGELKFYGNLHKNYLQDRYVSHILSEIGKSININQEFKIAYNQDVNEEHFLRFMTEIIDANFIKDPLKFRNHEAIVNFMEISDLDKITSMPSKVYESNFTGYIVKNYDMFHQEMLLNPILDNIENLKKEKESNKEIYPYDVNKQTILDHLMYIKEGFNYNKTLKHQNFFFSAPKEIFKEMDNYMKYESQSIHEVISCFIEKYKEYVEQNKEQLKWMSLVPFFESNLIPFRSFLFTEEQFVNQKRIWNILNSKTQYKKIKDRYFRATK